MKKLALLFVLSWSLTAQAEILDRIKIRGKVHGLSKTIVTLKTPTGLVKVPRENFNEKKTELKPNQDVTATASLTEVVEMNK